MLTCLGLHPLLTDRWSAVPVSHQPLIAIWRDPTTPLRVIRLLVYGAPDICSDFADRQVLYSHRTRDNRQLGDEQDALRLSGKAPYLAASTIPVFCPSPRRVQPADPARALPPHRLFELLPRPRVPFPRHLDQLILAVSGN